MPRFPRNQIQTSFLHILIQGIDKTYIFEKPEDIRYYIKNMNELLEDYNISIIAYCIMNNHAHILVKMQSIKELSNYMLKLNTRYGLYFNKKYDRVGYVFRNRYKSEEIFSKKHLNNCIRYIYNNPVKAGICPRPQDYPFSDYREINEDIVEKDYNFIDVEEVKCDIIIKDYLRKNNISLGDMKKDPEYLRELISILKNDYKISLRKIADELNIGRETVRKIYKN